MASFNAFHYWDDSPDYDDPRVDIEDEAFDWFYAQISDPLWGDTAAMGDLVQRWLHDTSVQKLAFELTTNLLSGEDAGLYGDLEADKDYVRASWLYQRIVQCFKSEDFTKELGTLIFLSGLTNSYYTLCYCQLDTTQVEAWAEDSGYVYDTTEDCWRAP